MEKSLDREGLVVMLFQQAEHLGIKEIQATASPFSFHLRFDGREAYTLLLLRSSDFWYKRVHLAQLRPSLLVVWEHDSFLPVDVLSIKTGGLWSRYTAPRIEKRSRYTASILLGRLMCGDKEGYQLLNDLPLPTRYRYLARVKELTKRPRGRPLKV
jgi:hypothetical protein